MLMDIKSKSALQANIIFVIFWNMKIHPSPNYIFFCTLMDSDDHDKRGLLSGCRNHLVELEREKL